MPLFPNVIQGIYIDQKNNPISNAKVEWYKNGQLISSDTTDINGVFRLNYEPTGIEDIMQNIWRIGPNPFSEQLNVDLTLRSAGTFYIYNLAGKLINQMELLRMGEYFIRWGGLTSNSGSISPGLYFLHVETKDKTLSLKQKIIYQGGGSSGISYEFKKRSEPFILSNINSGVNNRIASTIDSIRFRKKGTTQLVKTLSHNKEDQNLGNITGNVGPQLYKKSLSLKTYSNMSISVGLDSLFYNDDTTSISFMRNSKFELFDKVLTYTPEIDGVDSLWIYFTDVKDTLLSDSLFLDFQILNDPDSIPPELSFPQQIIINEDDSVILLIDQYAEDNRTEFDNLNWTFNAGSNLKVTFKKSTLIIKSALPDWYGQDSLQIFVMDMSNNTGNQDIEIIILSVNDPPVFNGPNISNIKTYQDSLVTLQANFSDKEKDSLYYQIINLPYGSALECNQDGICEIDLPENYYGTISDLMVLATDLVDTVFSNSFSLSVIKNNLPPVITSALEDVSFNEDEEYTGPSLNDYIWDDIDSISELTWSVSEGTNIFVEIDSVNKTPHYHSSMDFYGSEQIVFTVTDKEGLSDKDTINVSVLPVNDAPIRIMNIGKLYTDPNESLNMNIRQYFGDIDDTVSTSKMTVELFKLQNASWGILNDTLIQIEPNTDFVGDIPGLILKITDPGDLSIESDTFTITVNPFPCETWFIFKDATMDTLLSDNSGQIKYRLYLEDLSGFQWEQDSIKSVSQGIVKSKLYQGRTYEIDGIHPESVDEYTGISYTFYRREKDKHAFEQRSKNDQNSRIEVPTKSTDTIYVYKIIDESHTAEIIYWMQKFASEEENGDNIGIRKFIPGDSNAILWWDNNYLSLADPYDTYLNELKNDLKTVPFSYLTLPFEESNVQPANPHIRIAMDNSFIEPAINETLYTTEHAITLAQSLFQTGSSEYIFKKTIYESIADLNDLSSTGSGGEPPGDPVFALFTDPDYPPVKLNELGRKIFALLFLAQPVTQF